MWFNRRVCQERGFGGVLRRTKHKGAECRGSLSVLPAPKVAAGAMARGGVARALLLLPFMHGRSPAVHPSPAMLNRTVAPPWCC